MRLNIGVLSVILEGGLGISNVACVDKTNLGGEPRMLPVKRDPTAITSVKSWVFFVPEVATKARKIIPFVFLTSQFGAATRYISFLSCIFINVYIFRAPAFSSAIMFFFFYHFSRRRFFRLPVCFLSFSSLSVFVQTKWRRFRSSRSFLLFVLYLFISETELQFKSKRNTDFTLFSENMNTFFNIFPIFIIFYNWK